MPSKNILKSSLALAASLLTLAGPCSLAADAPIDIGSRRELFVDGALVDKLAGKAELRLHHPVPQEIAIVHDAPWEGSASGYHSIFKDGDLYRMYYKAWHLAGAPPRIKFESHPGFCCYAESKDGIHWSKPKLGLHEFRGSKANNIVFVSEKVGDDFERDRGHSLSKWSRQVHQAVRSLDEGVGQVLAALKDRSPDVRIAAAETLVNLGETAAAMPALEQALKDESVFARLSALTTVQRLGARAKPLLPAIQSKAAGKPDPAHKDASDYVGRMVGYLPEQLSR